VKKSIQDKIDALIKQAKASNLPNSSMENKNSIAVNDSLVKAIRNKKDADIFLAELELAIKMAHEQQ